MKSKIKLCDFKVYNADLSANLTDHFDAIFCAKYKEKFNKQLNNCQ